MATSVSETIYIVFVTYVSIPGLYLDISAQWIEKIIRSLCSFRSSPPPPPRTILNFSSLNSWLLARPLPPPPGGGPGVVVSTAAFHARVRGSVPGLGGLKGTKNVSSPSTCESQYCGEPPWPRCSVLGLRPPGLEFWILCLEDSVISFISPSSGGSPDPV